MKIFNDSLKFGVFPGNMKKAKVAPIFKSGKRELLINYRPVIGLCYFSKILERVM